MCDTIHDYQRFEDSQGSDIFTLSNACWRTWHRVDHYKFSNIMWYDTFHIHIYGNLSWWTPADQGGIITETSSWGCCDDGHLQLRVLWWWKPAAQCGIMTETSSSWCCDDGNQQIRVFWWWKPADQGVVMMETSGSGCCYDGLQQLRVVLCKMYMYLI